MEERQVIKKIKELRQIKPNKDWVCLTKSQILGQEKEIKAESWLFIPIRKPALVVAPLVVLAAVLGGLFVYFNFLSQLPQTPIITKISENQNQKEQAQQKQIVASLEKLRKSLEQATADLNKLAESKDTRKALQMTEVVKIVAQQVEGTVNQIKTPNIGSKEVLASLNAAQELGQAAENVRIGILIGYLSRRSLLTEEQKELLEEAEGYYDNGEYNQALITALQAQASQIR